MRTPLACLCVVLATACSSPPERTGSFGFAKFAESTFADTDGDGIPDARSPGAGADGQSAFRSFHDRDGDGVPDASARVVFRDQDGDGLPDALAPLRR